MQLVKIIKALPSSQVFSQQVLNNTDDRQTDKANDFIKKIVEGNQLMLLKFKEDTSFGFRSGLSL